MNQHSAFPSHSFFFNQRKTGLDSLMSKLFSQNRNTQLCLVLAHRILSLYKYINFILSEKINRRKPLTNLKNFSSMIEQSIYLRNTYVLVQRSNTMCKSKTPSCILQLSIGLLIWYQHSAAKNVKKIPLSSRSHANLYKSKNGRRRNSCPGISLFDVQVYGLKAGFHSYNSRGQLWRLTSPEKNQISTL